MLRRWLAGLQRTLARIRRGGWFWPGIVIVTTIVGALIVVWAVDENRRSDHIRPGAEVAGINIGGLAPREATEALEPLRSDVASTVIELQFQDHTITVTAEELGISLDTERTLAEADKPPPPVVRPAAWLLDLFATRNVEPSIATDVSRLQGAVTPYTDPETPRIALVDGAFEPVATTEIAIPDMELLARRLEKAVTGAMGARVTVVVPIAGMVPADPVALELATTLAAQANEITAGGVRLQLDGFEQVFRIGEQALRNFIVLEGDRHNTRLALDDKFANTLASLFVGVGTEGAPATVSIDDAGAVVISGGEPGSKCCSDTAAAWILWGMYGDLEVVRVPAASVPHPRGREWAESLGITEVVSEFTTNFQAGQQRVVNIARIAELTRGVIIEPGRRFSVNEFVGPRTAAKGFVPAGMILDGMFVDSVGGGISQYATTLFNAAFFAGLDFIEYQSHTIYLSRYPFGREATVSYPKPDLVLENNTPHAVMLWPTTTATSITVKMYSTPSVLAEQTGQRTRSVGTSCTRVTTERTRTWLADGRSETDTVWAQYRPEATRCDGSSTAPSTTTTAPSTTSTAPSTTLPEPACTAGCE